MKAKLSRTVLLFRYNRLVRASKTAEQSFLRSQAYGIYEMPTGRPFGTIPKCHLKLGHQKLTEYEIEQSLERLRRPTSQKVRRWWPAEHKHRTMSEDQISKIVERLYAKSASKATDANRVPKGRIRNMGVVNSFAWKGYN